MTKSPFANEESFAREALRWCLLAQGVDQAEADYTARGEAFFHVAGVGHAASVALAPWLGAKDVLHLHYRDKALMLARGIEPVEFFRSLFCKGTSHSLGRQMSAHMSAPELGVLSLVGPVGNQALQAVGVAVELRRQNPGASSRSVVVCSLGDGTTQQGEVLEAIHHGVREKLPVLFLVEDNQFAISVLTKGRTFYETPSGPLKEYMGCPIVRLDGRDVLGCYRGLGEVVEGLRHPDGGPALVVLNMERLTDHTNADSQASYRSAEEIAQARRQADPTERLMKVCLERNLLRADEVEALKEECRLQVEEAARAARREPDPEPCYDALPAWPLASEKSDLVEGSGRVQSAVAPETLRQPTYLEALRESLDAGLAGDERVTLFGQDIEDPKGDVFGVTRGLSTRYGRERVTNAPLAEATIVGLAVGQALAGGRPVAMLQFSDFLPIAFNQIACEMATIPWRTGGAQRMPVVVMAPCGAYRPGLGHFHAQTNDTLVAHVPGLDVAVPSNPADAAGLLNSALAAGRPTVFLYPKALLNDRDVASRTEPFDPRTHRVEFGKLRVVRSGRDVTLVGWGNAVLLCEKAAADLGAFGIEAEVLDLRTLAPWDAQGVMDSVKRTGALVVVHEDSHRAGFGAEVIATVVEGLGHPIQVRRVTRPDVPVPCHYPSQLEVLPSVGKIVAAVAEMLGAEGYATAAVADALASEGDADLVTVPAIGTSPTDEQILVTRWLVKVGEEVRAGQIVADIEADKANGEIASSVSGRVEELCVAVGESVAVGQPLLRIRSEAGVEDLCPGEQLARETVASARYQPRGYKIVRPWSGRSAVLVGGNQGERGQTRLGLSRPYGAKGSRVITNEMLVEVMPSRTAQEILDSCGVESRVTIGPGETTTSLANGAVGRLFARHRDWLKHLGLVVAATETAETGCPNLATLVLLELERLSGMTLDAAAVDVNAACSGWLYGLRLAQDYLEREPGKLGLVVTADVLSPLVGREDFSTRILFGDAATAMVVGNAEILRDCGMPAFLELNAPVLTAHGDREHSLVCPTPGRADGSRLHMNGPRVYREAVKAMGQCLREACRRDGVGLEDLSMVVPHQANQRILDAVERSLGHTGRVYSAIRFTGNTSASSIPLALEQWLGSGAAGQMEGEEKLGLVAFGGGFTAAAAVGYLRKEGLALGA